MEISQKNKLFLVVTVPLVLGFLIALVLMVRTSSFLEHYDQVLQKDFAEKLEAREMEVAFQGQVHEWKDILLRGSNPQDLARYSAAFFAKESQVREVLKRMENHQDLKLHNAVREFKEFHERLGVTYRSALARFLAGGAKDPFTVDMAIRGIDRPSAALIDNIVKMIETRITERNRSLVRNIRIERMVSLGLVIFSFGFAAFSLLRILDNLQKQEKRLRKKSQLEMVGRVSGGIAHHFNNLLTIILGHTTLLVEMHPPETKAGSSLLAIQKAAERGAAITSDLLAYSSKQSIHPTRVNVNKQIRGLEAQLRDMLGPFVRTEWELTPHLKPVLVDSNDLHQAVLNLAANSRDAMPHGGTFTICTSETTLDALSAEQHEGVSAGEYLKLSVTDTGTGMTAEALGQAFDPFFTTKDVGQGKGGLGLSMIYGFAKQSGGYVTAESTPGQGTAISLFLPCR